MNDTEDPDWDDDLDDMPHVPPDLHGQGLTSQQMATIVDIQPAGSYL